MGKRKSSPRLATTSRIDVVIYIISTPWMDIHEKRYFLYKLQLYWLHQDIMLG